MITVQETTAGNEYPNHRYILSDDKQFAYGYIREGEKLPQLFSEPIRFDIRGRKFTITLRTHDAETGNVWYIKGSKGQMHTVRKQDGKYNCSCPAFVYRRMECKHIQHVKDKNGHR